MGFNPIQAAQNAWSGAQRAANNTANNLQRSVDNAANNAQRSVNGVVNNVQRAAGNAANNVQRTVSSAASNVKRNAGDAATNVQRTVSRTANNVNRNVNNAANNAQRIAAGATNNIKRNVGNAASNIQRTAGTAASQARNLADKQISNVRSQAQGAQRQITSNFREAQTRLNTQVQSGVVKPLMQTKRNTEQSLIKAGNEIKNSANQLQKSIDKNVQSTQKLISMKTDSLEKQFNSGLSGKAGYERFSQRMDNVLKISEKVGDKLANFNQVGGIPKPGTRNINVAGEAIKTATDMSKGIGSLINGTPKWASSVGDLASGKEKFSKKEAAAAVFRSVSNLGFGIVTGAVDQAAKVVAPGGGRSFYSNSVKSLQQTLSDSYEKDVKKLGIDPNSKTSKTVEQFTDVAGAVASMLVPGTKKVPVVTKLKDSAVTANRTASGAAISKATSANVTSKSKSLTNLEKIQAEVSKHIRDGTDKGLNRSADGKSYSFNSENTPITLAKELPTLSNRAARSVKATAGAASDTLIHKAYSADPHLLNNLNGFVKKGGKIEVGRAGQQVSVTPRAGNTPAKMTIPPEYLDTASTMNPKSVANSLRTSLGDAYPELNQRGPSSNVNIGRHSLSKTPESTAVQPNGLIKGAHTTQAFNNAARNSVSRGAAIPIETTPKNAPLGIRTYNMGRIPQQGNYLPGAGYNPNNIKTVVNTRLVPDYVELAVKAQNQAIHNQKLNSMMRNEIPLPIEHIETVISKNGQKYDFTIYPKNVGGQIDISNIHPTLLN